VLTLGALRIAAVAGALLVRQCLQRGGLRARLAAPRGRDRQRLLDVRPQLPGHLRQGGAWGWSGIGSGVGLRTDSACSSYGRSCPITCAMAGLGLGRTS